MNEVIKILETRHSTRAFSAEKVKDEDLDLILRSVQNAPTSMSAQQVSLVVIREKDRIAEITKYTGNQPQVACADAFIVVCMDFNRTNTAVDLNGDKQCIHKTAEGLLVAATDAGIMVGLLDVAIQSLGYGSTIIGGLRDQPEACIKMMELPNMVYPLVGITIGVKKTGDQGQPRPRVPFDTFCFKERYDKDAVVRGVKQHEIDLTAYWQKLGVDMPSYYQCTAGIYKQLYYPATVPSLLKQGFGFEA